VRPDWRTRVLATKPVAGADSIAVDLQDAKTAAKALEAASDVTHVFYAAYRAQPDFAAEVAVNGPMLENLLEGLKTAGAPLERGRALSGRQGLRRPSRARALPVLRGSRQAYSAELLLHPGRHAATPRRCGRVRMVDPASRRRIGDVVGNPMNMAMVIGVFAALSMATATPLRFPGSAKVYDGVFAQVTDAKLLGRASLWSATADAARAEAFNYVHEPFRWERIWRGSDTGSASKSRLRCR
jgi:hypothetical protein